MLGQGLKRSISDNRSHLKKTKEKMVKPFDWNIGGKNKPMSDKKLTDKERAAIKEKYRIIKRKQSIKGIIFLVVMIVVFFLFFKFYV